MADTCTCGDVEDEHEPGGGACEVDGCDCICFEDGDDDG